MFNLKGAALFRPGTGFNPNPDVGLSLLWLPPVIPVEVDGTTTGLTRCQFVSCQLQEVDHPRFVLSLKLNRRLQSQWELIVKVHMMRKSPKHSDNDQF